MNTMKQEEGKAGKKMEVNTDRKEKEEKRTKRQQKKKKKRERNAKETMTGEN